MEVSLRKRVTRTERRTNKKEKIILILKSVISLMIVFILFYVGYGMYKEGNIRNLNSGESSTEILNIEGYNLVEEKKVIKMPEVELAKKYKGYEVDCRLEIPKIELNTNVLKEYTTEGLKICASKYYGPNANEIGNYCIAGHNYNKENMFNHLIDLNVGDSIFLTDNKNGIVEYIIYDIYKVKPQNVEPLSQETNENRELTLITCVNYSQNRLVVKATEKVL